jgi:flagellar motor switch protein FliG
MKDRVNQAYKGNTAKPSSGKEEVERPPETRGLKKTGRPGQAPATPRLAEAEERAERLLKTGGESGLSKAAKFLLLLGNDEASTVLAHLPPDEVEAISRELIKVKTIDPVEASDILAEFGWLVKTKGYMVEGGPETAQTMLKAAFGADRARELLRKAVPGSQKPFRFLEAFEPRELQLILKEESPQVLAVVLPYLDPKKASGLIERLSEELRLDVIKRVARLEKVSPEILRRVEEGLRERIRKIGTVTTEELDGKAALAGILRHVDPRMEESMLSALEDENPELSRDVRERLFTMDDVLRVPDKALQKALRDFHDRDIALLLKGREAAFKDKLLDNMSKNRRALVLDEYAVLGAVRREDADAAAREFLAFLKAAWEAGDLILDGDDDLVE